MMTSRDEFDFANDARAAVLQRMPASAWGQTLVIFFLVAAIIAWAMWAKLEEVTQAAGRVIPSSQLQVVQTIEPAIVSEILVTEGEIVEKDQVLLRLKSTAQESRAGEVRQRKYALLAEIARLNAEEQLTSTIQLPEGADAELNRAFADEQATLASRLTKLESERLILRTQLQQRQQELKELEATLNKLAATLEPISKEIELTRDLNKRGFVPEVELLRLMRQKAEIAGQIEVTEAALPRARAAIDESKQRFDIAYSVFRTEVLERLAKARSELAVVLETERDMADRVERTQLRAPTRGVVNKLSISTIGAVVQPGQDVVSIVPIDDTLEIEARIRPRDVAFIREGQMASVKLTAYDYTIYGALSGEVRRISADTITDSNGEAFYRAIVSTEQSHLDHVGSKLPILPGMQATVDIQTGEKTVLEYVLKPVSKLRHEALREN